MNKFFPLFFVLVFIGIFASCEQDLEVPTDNMVLVKLNVGGEIVDEYFSDWKGTRSTESNNTIGINVFVYDNDVKQYVGYAGGAFDDIRSISINLALGAKYKFCVCNMLGYRADVTNGFTYGSTIDLGTGGKRLGLSGYDMHPEYDLFYCELETTIGANISNINLELKRCSTKLCVKVNNLLVGKIRTDIKLPQNNCEWPYVETRSLFATYENPIVEYLFALETPILCWNNDEYSEIYECSFYYVNGDVENLIETRDLTFKRNTITNIEINIGNGLGTDGHYIVINLEQEFFNEDPIVIQSSI